jgi:hypothetical protein
MVGMEIMLTIFFKSARHSIPFSSLGILNIILMRFINKQKLAPYILSNIDEAEIFSYYLNVPVTEIYKCINNKSYRVCNNLRGDENPSFGLQYLSVRGGVKLYGKDFAHPAYTGDCFHLVGMALHLNCNNPIDFITICQDIIKRLFDGNYVKKPESTRKVIKNKTISTISIVARDYNLDDIKYWLSYNIRFDTVLKEQIYPVDQFYIDGVYQDYYYDKSNPAYAYYLGIDKTSEFWEVYRPNELKYYKFRTNHNTDIKELYLVKPNRNLIITKSKKDKLIIIQLLNDIGITDTDVFYMSESNVLSSSTKKLIEANYRDIYVMFDIDMAGINAMKYFNSTYGYKSFLFTNKDLITNIKNHPKDISDFSRKFGYDITKKLFTHLYNKYIL